MGVWTHLRVGDSGTLVEPSRAVLSFLCILVMEIRSARECRVSPSLPGEYSLNTTAVQRASVIGIVRFEGVLYGFFLPQKCTPDTKSAGHSDAIDLGIVSDCQSARYTSPACHFKTKAPH